MLTKLKWFYVHHFKMVPVDAEKLKKEFIEGTAMIGSIWGMNMYVSPEPSKLSQMIGKMKKFFRRK